MKHYWAKFKKINNNYFRFDTRIYLQPISKPTKYDICIGAVVGKNPGSALPSEISNELQIINLDNDKLLPNVLSIFLKAHKRADKKVPENAYIQILNLLYICNKNFDTAIQNIQKYSKPIICESENKTFIFLWYVWGRNDKRLNSYKKRFQKIKIKKPFYFNNTTKKIIESIPVNNISARHTQGLKHELVVPYIANIL